MRLSIPSRMLLKAILKSGRLLVYSFQFLLGCFLLAGSPEGANNPFKLSIPSRMLLDSGIYRIYKHMLILSIPSRMLLYFNADGDGVTHRPLSIPSRMLPIIIQNAQESVINLTFNSF